MRTVAIIPARYESSRYPGKPLVHLLGRPMIHWVAELSAKAVGVHNVYVATDDHRIVDSVDSAGFQYVMTGCAETGTDRLAEAAEKIDADIFINVQGDEPLIEPEDILAIRDAKLNNMGYVINGYCPLAVGESPESKNIPKVVTNEQGELLYMSRSPIPGVKEPGRVQPEFKKQVCIYAFTKEELLLFRGYGRKSALEVHEDIEILRFFEMGVRVLMVPTVPGSLAVDVPEDVPRVEAALKRYVGQS